MLTGGAKLVADLRVNSFEITRKRIEIGGASQM